MTVRTAERASAFAALAELRPDLSAGQVGVLVDVAAMLVDDGERSAAMQLVAVVLPDRDEARRIVGILIGAPAVTGRDDVEKAVDAAVARLTPVRRAVIKDGVPPLGISDHIQRFVAAEVAAEEEAAHRLLAVMPARLAEVVQQEVERRMAMFQAANDRSPSLTVMMPRRAAIESVLADLISGRLL